jgi:hypothetical protein
VLGDQTRALEHYERARKLAETQNQPKLQAQLWAALGPALRVEVRTRRVWVRLGGELLLPLPRQRYTLAESIVFSVPYVTFRSELVLGVPLS